MFKKTRNIYLAAVFLCFGATLVEVDKSDPRHQEFVFEIRDSEGQIEIGYLDKLELEYVNGKLMVNAADFREAIQRMKAIVHSD